MNEMGSKSYFDAKMRVTAELGILSFFSFAFFGAFFASVECRRSFLLL